MNEKGIPVSRWIDGVLEDERATSTSRTTSVPWCSGATRPTRRPVCLTWPRPWKSWTCWSSSIHIRPCRLSCTNKKDGVYLLPAATQFETYGSVTASNRSLQWRDKVVEPLFESLPDHTIMAKFAKKFGFRSRLFTQHQGQRQMTQAAHRRHHRANTTSGMWTIGYTGQSPERIKAAHEPTSRTSTRQRCKQVVVRLDGEYYGLPWPSWGTPEMKHPWYAEPL